MAGDIDTGMDKGEMKLLLMKSKKEPLSCAFGQGDDKTTALLMLDKVKQPKGVEKELTKKFPKANNTRFGTAYVDVDEDAKQVEFRINKPISGVARKLVKTLKGTGFTKVVIMLDDGSLVEKESGEEEGVPPQPGVTAKQPETEGGESEDAEATGTVPPGPPPPPPPPQPQAAKPDPAELTKQLAELIQRIPGVLAITPGLKDQLTKSATDARVNLKTGNLVYAATYIDQLRLALDNAPKAKETTPPTAPPLPPGAPKETYEKSRDLWLATRSRLESDIEKLRAEIVATYKEEDGLAAKLDAAYRTRVTPVLQTLDDSLAIKLGDAAKAADPQARAALVTEARTILQGHKAFVSGDATIGDLDANPFVPLQLRAMVGGMVDALIKTVH